MRPKEFQEKALEIFSDFLVELKKQEDKTEKRVAALQNAEAEVRDTDRDHFGNTWQELGRRGVLPQVKGEDGALHPPEYVQRKDERGQVVPHVCMKLPTGGGKTLLGVAALERMKPRSGLVLWIMPSRAIHKQTLKAFAYRMHPYRQWLERACGGRVKLLRKKDGFSLSDVQNYLCVMPLMLQAADRKNGNFLKIFRDTGKYPEFFPEPDDKTGNEALLDKYPDLHDVGDFRRAVKHSLFNALKIARPIIVLDEAHNAYTDNRRKLLCSLNPRFMLELSATPELGVSNILVDVPGAALKREQMIKLPLNIHNFENTNWKHTLSKAKERLDGLAREARKLEGESGRYIRPIMLIRVERVGKEQRDGQHIHAEDVRDYLVTQLNVPETHIRRKTAEKDEIADEDLLSPYSTVRYILTKDALREGWDCPFAYVLTLLDSTNAPRALTQMTGRVLRQPDTELTGRAALDESYIYCFDRNVGEAIGQVKKGLEQEGMSDLAEFVQSGGQGAKGVVAEVRKIRRRKKFRDMQIFLPNVLHRANGKSRGYRQLNYEKDVLGGVDWNAIAAAPLDIDVADIDRMREITAAVDLPGFNFDRDAEKTPIEVDKDLAVEFFVRRIYETMPNPWLAGHVVGRMFSFMHPKYNDDGIFDRRYNLSEALKQRLVVLVDHEAMKIFRHKLDSGDIRFELMADDSGFEFAHELEKIVEQEQQPLFNRDGDPLKKSLYEKMYVKEFNGLEKEFALYLDGYDAVTWWHRFAARQDYGLQGWRRHRVYPDFVVCVGKASDDARRVLVLETKGMQLSGNPDTQYKEKLLRTLEKVKPHTVEYGAVVRSKGKKRPMSLRMLFDQDYQMDFGKLVQE